MMTDIKKTANRVRAKLKGKLNKPKMYRIMEQVKQDRETTIMTKQDEMMVTIML